MEIVYKNIEELKEYENNPRDNNTAVGKVVESMELFGFVNPISINTENIIIAGHTRLRAAKQLGIDTVPCIVQDVATDEERMIRIIDNKTNEYSNWDVFKLQAELDSMPDTDKTFFNSGFRDVKTRVENLSMLFGKNEVPVTEPEYLRLKALFDEYVRREGSYLGFLSCLLEGTLCIK